jgi:hypothetical protein
VKQNAWRRCAAAGFSTRSPSSGFGDLALLASQICGAPMALISLVDSDRQWFKARVDLAVAQTPRDVAFCARAIEQPGLFVVPDALDDPRFRDNPFVRQEPHIRFYAGAPLVALPSYFGVDSDSGGRSQIQLGHFPVWKPPSAMEVCRAFRERFPSDEDCTVRPRSFPERIITVRIAMHALSSLVVAGALLLFVRKRTAA